MAMDPNKELVFIKLLDENQNLIHKVCRLYTNDEASHKDLFQEISIQLWNAYPKFRGDSKFTTWAYRIALNTAISLFRKKKRTINTIEFDSTVHRFEYKDYDYEEEEKLKQLYKGISNLNDIEKALIFMYLEDKDYQEISEVLGITQINARVRMNRVKNKLKQLLNP